MYHVTFEVSCTLAVWDSILMTVFSNDTMGKIAVEHQRSLHKERGVDLLKGRILSSIALPKDPEV